MWIDRETTWLSLFSSAETEVPQDFGYHPVDESLLPESQSDEIDGMAILHSRLRAMDQLSAEQEQHYFGLLHSLLNHMLNLIAYSDVGRQDLLLLFTALDLQLQPNIDGFSMAPHRSLLSDLKQLTDANSEDQTFKRLSTQIMILDKKTQLFDSQYLQLITMLSRIDWPHQLLLALVARQFAKQKYKLNQRQDYSAVLNAYLCQADEQIANAKDLIPFKGKVEKEQLQELKDTLNKYYQCRNYLANHNLRLVYHVAKKYAKTPNEIRDIFQEGVFGLLRAIELYEPKTGNKFSTYAYHWIDSKVRIAPVLQRGVMRLPSSAMVDVKQLKSTVDDLKQQGLPQSMTMLVKHSGLRQSRIKDLLAFNNNAVSLEQPINESAEDLQYYGTIALDQRTVIDNAAISELAERIDSILNQFEKREAYIIRSRYGLKGHEVRSLQEISHQLQLSRERVRQIEIQVLKKLKDCLAEQIDIDVESLNSE